MDEIRPCSVFNDSDLGLEELEERLESANALPAGEDLQEPCVWACECFAAYYMSFGSV